MKRLLILLLMIPSVLWAQKVDTIRLSFNKTVHLFFPDKVSYYDIGSDAVMGEGKGTILKIAPKQDNFEETNLTVITSDNICYAFLLEYKEDISVFNYFMNASNGRRIITKEAKGSVKSESDSIQILKNEKDTLYIPLCRSIAKQAPTYWNVGASTKKIFLAINNVYVYNDLLFFVVGFGNQSTINYDIDFLKLYVASKRKLKKSSIQEEVKTPEFVYNSTEQIKAGTKDYFIVMVFKKFTMASDKKLVFELYEKNGGRNISFDVTRDLINNARTF